VPSHRLEARRPRGTPRVAVQTVDPDRLRSVVEDAAHVAGHAAALAAPATEADVAEGTLAVVCIAGSEERQQVWLSPPIEVP
jgi:hypothetical protein